MDKKAFQNIQRKLGLTLVGVSEALDVELFTVQQWGSGLWPIPKPMVKFLYTLLSMKRDNEDIYMAGYHRGQKEGYEKGRLSQVEGYTTGYDEGYLEGKAVGLREEQNKGRFDVGFLKGYDKGHRVGYEAVMKSIGIGIGID